MAYEPSIRLPHAGLQVSRIGLAASFGVPPEGLEIAFDHGINYFYWGSVRRPGFAEGIRRLAPRHREQMVVVLQSYARWPAQLMRFAVDNGLRKLKLDYADVLLLGWFNRRPPQWILDEAMELREKGRVRALMMSGHQRTFFPEMAREEIFDAFMVRYNAVHRGAEREVFPRLPEGDAHPGIVAYTATRWGNLLDPRNAPDGERVPTASDCYRFCLANPAVDVVLCGPETVEHVHEACAALGKGPLDAEDLAWMRRVGDHIYERSRVKKLVD